MTKQISSSGKFWVLSNPDLRQRLMFLLGALIVFRIGSHVPVPGVDAVSLAERLSHSAGSGMLSMLNMFSGGSLERFSIFAIGIMPYISASIIMQLAGEIIPSLKALKKEGEAGRKVITKYTRIATVVLATFQSLGVAAFVYQYGVVVISQIEFYISTVFCLVGGTMFLMWLGEQITERGIGNGISLLITAGIVSAFPTALIQLFELISGDGGRGGMILLALGVGILVMLYLIGFIESALRKVPVHYARQKIGVMNQNTHMPFKLNMAGVIPPIFASSIIMFPTMLAGWFSTSDPNGWLNKVVALLQHGTPIYMLLFASTIIFFCYFYTALAFSPKEMAENLKKSGAFVPSIRPGEQTAKYLEKVVLNLTLFGALYITLVCLIPEVLTTMLNIPFYLGGTSLLIVVVVAMDFRTQIDSYQVTQNYEKLMIRRIENK